MRLICLLYLFFCASMLHGQPLESYLQEAAKAPCPKYQEAMRAGEAFLDKDEPDWDKALIEFQAAQIAARECALADGMESIMLTAANMRLQQVLTGLQDQRDQAIADRRRAQRAERQALRALSLADQKTREAEQQRDRADSLRLAAERTGEANRLAAKALEIQEDDPTLAARLADYAYRYSGRRNPLAAKIRRNVYQRTDRPLYTTGLIGHSGQIQAHAFSPDGQYILTADRSSIILWDLEGRQLQHLNHPQESIMSVKFSPDGRYFLSGGIDRTAILWSVDGEMLQILQGHQGRILDVAFTADGQELLTASTDGTIRRWNRQGEQMQQYEVQWGLLPTVVFSPDGRQVITSAGGQSGEVKLFELAGDSITVRRYTPLNFPGPIPAIGFYSRANINSSQVQGSDLHIPWYTNQGGGVMSYDQYGPSVGEDSVMDLIFTPPAGRVASWGPDGKIAVHDLAGNLLFEKIGQQALESARFSPDGRHLLTTHQLIGTAYLWQLEPNPSVSYGRHQAPIRSVDVSHDGQHILLGSSDGTATLWNAQGSYLCTLSGHNGRILSVDFSPNGQAILTGSSDNTARLWDLQGRMLHTYHGPESEVRAVQFDPDRKIPTVGVIAHASSDIVYEFSDDNHRRIWSKVEIWDYAISPTDGSALIGTAQGMAVLWDGSFEVDTLKHSEDHVFAVAYSPDGQYLLTGGNDDMARLWTRQGELLQEFIGHESSVFDVTFSPDGQYVLTASQDRTARLWNLDGQEIQQFVGHQGIVRAVAFFPDGRHILTGSDDHTARIWTLDGQTIQQLGGHQDVVPDIAVSPDGQFILSSSGDRSAAIWDRQGNMLQRLSGHERLIYAVAISPDGLTRLTGDRDGRLRLWGAEGQEIRSWQAHEGPLLDAAFSPDGEYILTGGVDDKLILWDLQGRPARTFLGHRSNIRALAFSSDGQYVLSSGDDKTARLWSIDGSLLLTLEDFLSDVTFVAFTPDGQHLLTGSVIGDLRIWDLQGRPVRRLNTGFFKKAALSPDGATLLLALEESTAVLMDLYGNELQNFADPLQRTLAVAFAPDGRSIFTTGSDHCIREWVTIDTYFNEKQELDFSQALTNEVAFDYRKSARPGYVLDYGMNMYRSYNSTDPESTFSFLDTARQVFAFLVDKWGAPYHYYLSNVEYAHGLHYLRQGAFSEAIDYFQQSLDTDPEQIWIEVYLATTWVFSGEYDRAKAIYEKRRDATWDAAWPIEATAWMEAFRKVLDHWESVVPETDAATVQKARSLLQATE